MTTHRRLGRVIKAGASRLLVLGGAPALLRLGRRRDALVLAYHNIVPDDAPACGDVPLHLPQTRFAAQLEIVARRSEPVPLADLLAPPPRRQRKPRLAITFDDAYRGAVTLGTAELARHGIPATIFVSPHFLGRTFWWDAVSWPSGTSWGVPFRDRALDMLAGRDDLARRAAAENGLLIREPPDYLRCASEEELRAALAAAPITLGSHTWSHPNLAALAPADVREELHRPLEWLSARFDRVEPILAYPYGRVSDPVVHAARAVGYKAAVGVGGGWIRGTPRDPLRIPRLNIGRDLSMDLFILSTAGLVRV
jgi:peptidoglycan/xylan/chitin deacetylase (PgdA/CDA1 family)